MAAWVDEQIRIEERLGNGELWPGKDFNSFGPFTNYFLGPRPLRGEMLITTCLLNFLGL